MRVPASSWPATDTVRAVVDIAAPPDAVFHALSDPGELAAWLGGEESGGERRPGDSSGGPGTPPLHLAAGRSWRAPALAPDGTPGSVGGEYLVVDPPRRLESTWRASWDDFAPDRVRFELAPIDVGGAPGTRLTLTHTRGVAGLHVTAQAAVWPTARAIPQAIARVPARATALAGHAWLLTLLARLDAHVTMRRVVASGGASPAAVRGGRSGRPPHLPVAIHHGE